MARIIAVTGKGGTGKTVISALVIRHLKEHATGPVLAMDADPDANLATVLGIPMDKTVGDLREETVKELKDLPAGMSKGAYLEAGLHQVVEEGEKVDLITMGRCEGPGCYCYVNNLLRQFSDKLQGAYEWIVMDNEAGLEHLSRRTAAHIDHLVVVINNNPLSIDCARRIDGITEDIKHGVGNKGLLANNVDNGDNLERLRGLTAELRMDFLGSVPHDPVVEDVIFEGRSLIELEESAAVAKIAEIMQPIMGAGAK